MSSPAITAPASRVFGLDVLRAMAIISVVFSHGLPALYGHVPYLFFLGYGGFVGVELFFVLSGFLIGGILIRSGERLRHGGELLGFYVRRWMRTLPLFWLFLAINVIIEYAWHQHRVGWSEALGHLCFTRTLWKYDLSFMPESWSLAVEEWFYLLFPAALWLALQTKGKFDRIFLLTAGAFWTFSTVARTWVALDPATNWATVERCVVIYRFDGLMMGIVAAWLAHRWPDAWRRHRRVCAIAGGLLMLAMYATGWHYLGGIAERSEGFFIRSPRFALLSLGFVLVLPWAASWSLARETLLSTAFRRIALWSYVLYLVHSPWNYFTERWHFANTGLIAGGFIFIFQVGGAIAVSALIYHWAELPLMAWRERVSGWLKRRSREKTTPATPAASNS
jgi:peptidoglycan/LPS O-acetylase OafA/YrhL